MRKAERDREMRQVLQTEFLGEMGILYQFMDLAGNMAHSK